MFSLLQVLLFFLPSMLCVQEELFFEKFYPCTSRENLSRSVGIVNFTRKGGFFHERFSICFIIFVVVFLVADTVAVVYRKLSGIRVQ